MKKEEVDVTAFEIILSAGTARGKLHEAFKLMRAKDYAGAEKLMEEANEDIVSAHKAQTSLLTNYASGEEIIIEIIMVHAQDHLMTTMLLEEVAQEMLFLHQKADKEG